MWHPEKKRSGKLVCSIPIFAAPICAEVSIASRLMFCVLQSIRSPPRPVLCASNQLYLRHICETRLYRRGVLPKPGWPADLMQVCEGSAGGRCTEEHGKEIQHQVAQLHSGWVQIGWQLNSPGQGGEMRERAEAGSSCPVILTQVKSDTVAVWGFSFPSPGSQNLMKGKWSAAIVAVSRLKVCFLELSVSFV